MTNGSLDRRLRQLEKNIPQDTVEPKIIVVSYPGVANKRCPGYSDVKICARYKESPEPQAGCARVIVLNCDVCKGVAV